MKSSRQAGYLIYWPEPRSTGCSILKCTPTGNPTMVETQLKRGRFSPESQSTYPKVLEKSLNWKKANLRIIQAAGGMNIKWDHSQKLAGRSGWSGWWGYVRIIDMVRVVRMVRMLSKSSESGEQEANSWDKVWSLQECWLNTLLEGREAGVGRLCPSHFHSFP